MNESYAEAGVKREKTASTYFAKFGIIFAIVFVFVVGGMFLGSIATFIACIGIVLCIFLFPRFNVEYEYIYCDGQLDFDRITGNSKRKNVLRIDFEKVDMVAPVKSHALDNYKNMQVTEKDFTSKNPDAKVYAIICHGEKGNMRILFEPNDKMVACIKQKTPRKISEI